MGPAVQIRLTKSFGRRDYRNATRVTSRSRERTHIFSLLFSPPRSRFCLTRWACRLFQACARENIIGLSLFFSFIFCSLGINLFPPRGGLSRRVFIWRGAVDAWRPGRSGSVGRLRGRTGRVVGSDPICFAADVDPTGKER